MKESKFQKQCLEYLETLPHYWGYQTWGGSIFQKTGLPDLVFCYKGVFCGVELKVEGYEPTALQLATLNNIQDSGGIGLIVKSDINDLKRIIKTIDDNKPFNTIQKKYEVRNDIIWE